MIVYWPLCEYFIPPRWVFAEDERERDSNRDGPPNLTKNYEQLRLGATSAREHRTVPDNGKAKLQISARGRFWSAFCSAARPDPVFTRHSHYSVACFTRRTSRRRSIFITESNRTCAVVVECGPYKKCFILMGFAGRPEREGWLVFWTRPWPPRRGTVPWIGGLVMRLWTKEFRTYLSESLSPKEGELGGCWGRES